VQVELTEAAAVVDQLLRGDVLVAEKEDAVLVPRRADRGDRRVLQTLAQVEVHDLGAESVGQAPGLQPGFRTAQVCCIHESSPFYCGWMPSCFTNAVRRS